MVRERVIVDDVELELVEPRAARAAWISSGSGSPSRGLGGSS
jgi:hypothetical protein